MSGEEAGFRRGAMDPLNDPERGALPARAGAQMRDKQGGH
jgi:hypothetical protein